MYYAHIIRQYFKLNFYEVSKSIPLSTEVASHPLFIIFFLMGKLSLTRNWGQKKKKKGSKTKRCVNCCLFIYEQLPVSVSDEAEADTFLRSR